MELATDIMRADFESFIVKEFEVKNPTAEKRRDSGEYFYAHVNLAWSAWCEAKRNMPVVELPSPYCDYDEDDNPYRYWSKKDVVNCLKSSGIQYTIKGE